MAVRALIIAIEEYPDAKEGLPKKLAGSLAAGLDFKKQLQGKWKAEGRLDSDTKIIFCSSPKQPGDMTATAKDIRKALCELKKGRGMTEDLYVFFSGHGFAFLERPGSRTDVIIAADFENRMLSGDCCLNLDEMVNWLRDHLGPGCHYYFVDACRNALNGNQVAPGSLLPFDTNATSEASTFVLQSTAKGAVAAVGPGFSQALVAGLRGDGKSKVWDPAWTDAMVVKYESLFTYVRDALKPQQVTSRSDGPLSPGEAVLSIIRPVPQQTLTVRITGLGPEDEGLLVIHPVRGGTPRSIPFKHAPLPQQLEPGDYSILVKLKNGFVTALDSTAVSLFSDATVRFQKTMPPAGGETSTPSVASIDAGSLEAAIVIQAELDVLVPKDAQFKLRNVETGQVHLIDSSMKLKLTQGRYAASLRNKDSLLLRRSDITIRAGESVSLDVAKWRSSVPHMSIAQHLPLQDGAPDFSESLGGAVTDPDLGLWLALLGGGRILGSRGDYSKIAHFPLHDFSQEKSGASPAYILAGLENPQTLEVSVSPTAEPNWQKANQVLPGIYEVYFPTHPGAQLVSFRIANEATYTLASFSSPNRGLLITLTFDEQGEFNLAQYLLPLGHLIDQLPEEMAWRITNRNHLQDVRFLAQAHRAFQKRRVLKSEFKTHELEELLYAKWLDPIGSSLASYELIRRGEKGLLGEVVGNMNNFFPDLPDTAALSKLVGHSLPNPKVTPLFLDGLRAYPDYADWLPLPASNLDFTSAWTAWRAALK